MSPAWQRWHEVEARLRALEERLDACWADYDATGRTPPEELMRAVYALRDEAQQALDALLGERQGRLPGQGAG